MPISCTCPQCERVYNVKDDAAGRKFTCQDCSAIVEVPGGSKPAQAVKPQRHDIGAVDDDWGDDDFGAPAPRRSSSKGSSRRRSRSEGGGNGDGLAKASVWIGGIVWGLGVLTIAVTALLGASVFSQIGGGGGAARPGDAAVVSAGFSMMFSCGYLLCLAPIATLTGTILAVIGLNQPLTSKTPAVAGLVLNAGYLVLMGGFFLLSLIAR